jgi:hypothetical protein
MMWHALIMFVPSFGLGTVWKREARTLTREE